jgi:16S rRNA C967 or C1407 C5-methylase (RsmB/RsmF family)
MLRLAGALFSEVTDQERFLSALSSGDMARSSVLHVRGASEADVSIGLGRESPPWLPAWISFPDPDSRPGLDPRHQAGDWYLLDLSSVFCASPLQEVSRTLREQPPRILIDVCASPGGKALLGWKALSPQLLIANEAVHGRITALISNLKRCRIDPCVVLGRDPERLADELGAVADVVVVDAPCSGQSLLLKGKSSPGGFHPATVQMNSKRQRRILANAARLVAPEGHLLYSTCTFSKAENEGVIEWFLKKFPEFESCAVASLAAHRSLLTEAHCYRLFPFEGFGAGGFTCLLKRTAHAARAALPDQRPHIEWKSAAGGEAFEALLRELSE